MEFLKIVLLFSIFIACTLSHRPVETQKERQTAIRESDSGLKSNRPAKNKENCNRKSCWQNKVLINEQCTCFPLNSYNIPVPRYVLNDPRELLARTVVYIYTVGNKSSIYIPNLEKQSRFIDLTFDDGDIFKPLSSQNAKLLLAQDTELSEVKNENRRPNILENEIINQPISIHNVKKVDFPINSEDVNREALKDILESHVDNIVAQNNWPPSQGYFDQHGPSNPIHIDKSQSVFNPDEYEYDNFRKPKPIIISKPRDKNVISQNPNANIDVPYDFVESTFENIGVNPSEHEKHFMQEEFEFSELQDTLDLNPITQDKQVYNKPLVISGLSPNKDKHLHQPDRPLSFEPKPSEKNVNVLDFDLSSSIISKPANGDEFYINSFPQPQKNFELEISENQLPSDNLYKSNIKCSSGICKLYIYCSRNDCPKYLQSLAQLHTTIHKHPLLDNTYVAINNARANESDALHLRPIPNLIGLEDADEEVQNIRQSGDQNPLHLLTQPIPRSIPINFNPLSNILDQGQVVQNLVPVNQHQQRPVEYYPMNNPILSTQYRDSPYSRDIIIPRQVNDKYDRRNYGLTSKNDGSFLKELLLLPSEIHHKGMRKMADLLPDLGLRKNDVDVEEIETPVDEDDIKIKIVGGKPAISSGTPMQIKARLGDIV